MPHAELIRELAFDLDGRLDQADLSFQRFALESAYETLQVEMPPLTSELLGPDCDDRSWDYEASCDSGYVSTRGVPSPT